MASVESPSKIPLKGPGSDTPIGVESAHHPQVDSLPSYTAYESQQPWPVQPYPVAPYPYYYTGPMQLPRRNSARRRFCIAFTAAFMIWVFMVALIQSIVIVTHNSAMIDDWPDDEDFPIPPDLERVRCVWGDGAPDHVPLKASFKKILQAPLTFPFKKEEKFELSIDSDNLFFLSRGIYSGGKVTIEQSHEEGDVAKVEVRLEYLRPGGPRIAKVCQFKRGDGEDGIGVFTPKLARYPRHHNLRFFVTIKFPKSNTSDYLYIKKLETDMPDFTQHLVELGKGIFFDDLSLKSSNGAIISGPLVAQQGTIETSNSPVLVDLTSFGPFDITSRNGAIHGTFHATGSLTLKTSNERIKGRVFINTNDNEEARLEMITSNSVIDTEVLLTHSNDSAPGDFTVLAKSTNSPIRLKISDAPVDSRLFLNAETQNSPVDVILHPTFEGDFEVTSINFWPTVSVRSPQDPSGKGRERDLQFSREGNYVKGSVSWSDEGKERGHVNIKTSNSPAVLRL
ncbi:hypothetical protein AX15_005420 [Amanita polypyramis BW_CC]|nr:hypothetical protein AX15_005420 [Amanita polypyramis BW_CC]